VVHVFDYVVGRMSGLFRFHNYSPFEKVYAALLFVAGLSLRDISKRYCLTSASRESVRCLVHRLGQLFTPERKCRRLVAVDETVEKASGQTVHLWSAVDVDTGEIIAVYASRGRSILNALTFLRTVLKACDGKPVVVVDRGPWYPWALKRLGIEYLHETFGNRNKVERWFRELKDRTKRFYNNINSKTVKSIEEIATAIALIHNILLNTQREEV
ncbi:MAG: DDE-type integrase/transposase/recombinase, partial [Nitrososphaerota archaeon]